MYLKCRITCNLFYTSRFIKEGAFPDISSSILPVPFDIASRPSTRKSTSTLNNAKQTRWLPETNITRAYHYRRYYHTTAAFLEISACCDDDV